MRSNYQLQNIQNEDEYVTKYEDGTMQVRSENILTTDQVLFPDMLLLKIEGLHVDVVRILDLWVEDGFLYIKLEDRKTGKVGMISQKLGINYHLWTLVSYDYFIDKLISRANQKGTEIEFDY